MDGPRGSLVIGLLFLIAGQLAFIASALTGGTGHALVGVVMTVFFVLAVVRVVVELFREGAAEQRAEEKRERAAARAGQPFSDPQKRRPPHA